MKHAFLFVFLISGLAPIIYDPAFYLFSQNTVPSVNLPLDHYVYDLFERWETDQILPPDIRLRNKPFDRQTVLRMIRHVDSLLLQQHISLSKSDRQLLAKLKGEFHQELLNTTMDYDQKEKEKHLFHWQNNAEPHKTYLIADAIFDPSVRLNRFSSGEDSLNESISYTSVMGTVRGLLKGAIAFYSDFTSTLIKGSDIRESNFQPTPIGIINKASQVYSQEANAYLVMEPTYFRLQFGKDKLILGPGQRNNLFLSAHAPAFDNLRLDVTFDRIKFTYFHGFLRSPEYPYWYDSSRSDRKYIAGHRVEFKIFPWLFLAGNESVIYGGRALETQYLNPVMVYHIAEQYAGDKDNNTMSFDVTVFPKSGWKFYGCLFLDDYRLADNPFTYWKQQWALMGGLFKTNPFGLPSSSLRFEYARLEPFVYTHKFTLINYTHFETSLGASIPPNSDDYSMEFRWQPSRPFWFIFNYAFTRHGEGNIKTSGEEQGYGQPGKERKKFLSGVCEKRHNTGLAFYWEPIPHHRLYILFHLIHARNYENAANRHLTQQAFLAGYRLNY